MGALGCEGVWGAQGCWEVLGVTHSEVSGWAHLCVEGRLWGIGVSGPHVRVGWLWPWGQQGSAGATLQGTVLTVSVQQWRVGVCCWQGEKGFVYGS